MLEIGGFFGINTDLRINPNSIPHTVQIRMTLNHVYVNRVFSKIKCATLPQWHNCMCVMRIVDLCGQHVYDALTSNHKAKKHAWLVPIGSVHMCHLFGKTLGNLDPPASRPCVRFTLTEY